MNSDRTSISSDGLDSDETFASITTYEKDFLNNNLDRGLVDSAYESALRSRRIRMSDESFNADSSDSSSDVSSDSA